MTDRQTANIASLSGDRVTSLHTSFVNTSTSLSSVMGGASECTLLAGHVRLSVPNVCQHIISGGEAPARSAQEAAEVPRNVGIFRKPRSERRGKGPDWGQEGSRSRPWGAPGKRCADGALYNEASNEKRAKLSAAEGGKGAISPGLYLAVGMSGSGPQTIEK